MLKVQRKKQEQRLFKVYLEDEGPHSISAKEDQIFICNSNTRKIYIYTLHGNLIKTHNLDGMTRPLLSYSCRGSTLLCDHEREKLHVFCVGQNGAISEIKTDLAIYSPNNACLISSDLFVYSQRRGEIIKFTFL